MSATFSIRKCLVLFFAAMIVASCSKSTKVDSLTVSRAWTRPTPATSNIAALYFTVESPVKDELISVSTPIAAKATVHATSGDDSSLGGGHHGSGGQITMHGSQLNVSPEKAATLSPGGMHIMLEGLRKPLQEGDVFTLQLTFKVGGTVTTSVRVALNGL